MSWRSQCSRRSTHIQQYANSLASRLVAKPGRSPNDADSLADDSKRFEIKDARNIRRDRVKR